MSSSIALLTRNNFIAAKLTFHSEFNGVKSVLTTEENIVKAFTVFHDDKELLTTPNYDLKRIDINISEISIPIMLKFEIV